MSALTFFIKWFGNVLLIVVGLMMAMGLIGFLLHNKNPYMLLGILSAAIIFIALKLTWDER